MKKYLFFSLLFLIACANPPSDTNEDKETHEEASETSQPTSPPSQVALNKAINDRWELVKIEGENFVMEEQNGLKKVPQIEIIVNDLKFQGSDGCNTLQGSIGSTEKGKIDFTQISQTKMACENMETPDRFTNALTASKKYNAQAGYLFLYDDNNKELLRFKQVKE